MSYELTYKQLDTLSIDELRYIVFIKVNPFRMSQRELEYIRLAQDEYFKRLSSRNKGQ